MATQKFTDLTATTTPNTESVFAIAYSGSNFKLTITDLAAHLPAVTATSLTSSSTLTTTSNATIGGDLTISGNDLFMATNTSGAALIADGTNFNPVVISGDISIGSTGTAAIGTGVIVNADVNASAAIDATKIHDGTVSNTEFGYLNGVSSAIQTQMDTKITASSTDTLTNKSGNISQWTNDSGYLTSFTETNDLSAAVTWANVPDANITQSSVTQHQAALSITESQISDLGSYITASSTDTLTNKTFDANGTGNSLSNVEVADLASGVLDTDISSVSASDDTLASAKAIKTIMKRFKCLQTHLV